MKRHFNHRQQELYEFYHDNSQKPWIMGFGDLCTAIALELGRDPSHSELIDSLRKYYNEGCFWDFDTVVGIMAEQIANELGAHGR